MLKFTWPDPQLSRRSSPIISRRHIKNRPHPNLYDLLIHHIRNPRPKEPHPPLHRRIQQPQTRRPHKLPTDHRIRLPHHQLQRQRAEREALVVPTGLRVRRGMGGGRLEEADECGGGGQVGTYGDEGGEEACVAVREVLDSESQVSSLGWEWGCAGEEVGFWAMVAGGDIFVD